MLLEIKLLHVLCEGVMFATSVASVKPRVLSTCARVAAQTGKVFVYKSLPLAYIANKLGPIELEIQYDGKSSDW